MAGFNWRVLSNDNLSDNYAVARFEGIEATEDFGAIGYSGRVYFNF